ncbi:hypothetical protein AB6A40_009981 [Gnathostoma spinigerum]|uniref:Uncharacterized protein n=1 Tax=Gnathostoma spinigerum TaxID=75299 RepID=A0ABD6F1V2_9BILA
MKKEWILNEEQLRRRKNSRLNHMQQVTHGNSSGASNARIPVSVATSANMVSSAPNTPSSVSAPHIRRGTDQQMVSPPIVNPFQMLSPSGSTASPSVLSSSSPDSPTRSILLGLPQIDNNGDAYESNMMRLQRQQAAANAAFANLRRNGCGPILSQGSTSTVSRTVDQFSVKSEPHVTMSVEEYQALIKAAKAGGAVLPGSGAPAVVPTFGEDIKRNVYSPTEHESLINIGNSHGIIRPTLIQGSQLTDFTDLSVAASNTVRSNFKLTPEMEKKVKYIHDTIQSELNLDSPQTTEPEALKNAMYGEGESRLNYQLNSAELRALDITMRAYETGYSSIA